MSCGCFCMHCRVARKVVLSQNSGLNFLTFLAASELNKIFETLCSKSSVIVSKYLANCFINKMFSKIAENWFSVEEACSDEGTAVTYRHQVWGSAGQAAVGDGREATTGVCSEHQHCHISRQVKFHIMYNLPEVRQKFAKNLQWLLTWHLKDV